MAFKVLQFIGRKAGTTPDQFKDHYENKHVPLVKSLTGDKFPQSHTRRYIHRTADGDKFPATVLFGSQSDFDYEVICELSFADKTAFQAFAAVYGSEDVVKALSEDEKNFTEDGRVVAVVIGDVRESA